MDALALRILWFRSVGCERSYIDFFLLMLLLELVDEVLADPHRLYLDRRRVLAKRPLC